MPEPAERIETVIENAFRETFERVRREAGEALTQQCSRALEAAVKEARDQEIQRLNREGYDDLAAAVRRIRSGQTVNGVAGALLEAASRYCGRTALLTHRDEKMFGFRLWAADGLAARFASLRFPLSEAGALARAVATRRKVRAPGRAAELSAGLADLLSLEAGECVWLFPLVVSGRTPAVLYADGRGREPEQEVQSAAVEILTSVAEAWIEALSARAATPPESGAGPEDEANALRDGKASAV